MRYLGGVLLAGALSGLIACPILLFFMQLNREERTQVIAVLASAAVILPVAWLLLKTADRLSVPATLVDMTGDGWECVAINTPTTG
ncbi:MAG: hypothetical protein JWN40_4070 [Phycisphaerales bacterium]|nr:hypothetical protein [Phycisphaerales bacterium]